MEVSAFMWNPQRMEVDLRKELEIQKNIITFADLFLCFILKRNNKSAE